MLDVDSPKSVDDTDESQTKRARAGAIDCDIHPSFSSMSELLPYVSRQWAEHLQQFGVHQRKIFDTALNYPRQAHETARHDAWPPGGGTPGSNLAFMQQQHLDAHDIAYGVLQPLRPGPSSERNLELAHALSRAVNEWQVEKWLNNDERLLGSIVIAHDDPPLAVAEMEYWKSRGRFVQVCLPPASIEPLGRRRYWPIYEAASALDIAFGLHVSGVSGHPTTGGGWGSFYIEDHNANVHNMQNVVVSLIMEGVLERWPNLKFVLIEGGLGWAAALGWRMDKAWRAYRSELPHLKRPPSEYLRENFWFTTQPIEEPHKPSMLSRLFEQVGWDRILFSTDYPHWDMDDPATALPALPPGRKEQILRGNAAALYGLTL